MNRGPGAGPAWGGGRYVKGGGDSEIIQDLLRFHDVDPIFKVYQISIPGLSKIYFRPAVPGSIAQSVRPDSSTSVDQSAQLLQNYEACSDCNQC